MIRKTLVLLVGAVVSAVASTAAAQGLGPVTGTVGESDPTEYSFRFGPIMFFSGLAVRSIGVDQNVFDEPVDPKRDFHAIANPDFNLYLRTASVRFTLTSAAEFVYYKKYASERTMNRTARARADVLLFSTLRPYVVAGTVQSRDRANAEIDVRAQRENREIGGGVTWGATPLTTVFVGATRTDYAFDEGETMRVREREGDAFREVALDRALNRRNESAAVGFWKQLTPLTKMQVTLRASRDRFDFARQRDSDAYAGTVNFTFDPAALFRGDVTIGFQQFKPRDPAVRTYSGMTMSGGIFWPLTTTLRMDLNVNRGVEYSFEETEPYYVDTGARLTFTQRVISRFDVQAEGSYRWLRYGHGAVIDNPTLAPRDEVRSVLAGIGYNLEDRSRFAINYEVTRRSSDRRGDRAFERPRIFGSWQYQF